jgi:PST family polysaccharide transporter
VSPNGREPEVDETDLDPVPGDLTGTVIRGAGLAGAGYILTQALTLGFYLALARIATPEDFGEFASAAIVINAGLLFTEAGMLAALIRRKDRLEEAAATAVVSTAIGGLVFSLLALAASPLIGAFFDSDRIAALAAALSGLLLVRSFQVVPEALLQRNFNFVRRLVIQPVQVIAFGVAAVIATSDGLGPWGLVIGFYAAAFTDVLLSWILVRWRPRFSLASFGMWRELIDYGRHVLGSNIVHRVGEQIPTALMGRYVGQGPLGQYRYSDRIATMPFMLVVSAASYVVFPAFARISSDRRRFTTAFVESLRWFATLAMPLGLILIPLGIPLAVTLFGEVWRPAGEGAMALSGFMIAASMISIVSEALKAEGRPEILTRIHTVTGITGAIAMVALLGFDLVGVAIGYSIGSIIGAVYALAKLSRLLQIPPATIGRQLWPPFVAAVVMAGAVFALDRLVLDSADQDTVTALAMLAVEGIVALGIYLAAISMVAPDTIGRVRELIAGARRGDAGEGKPS